MTTFTHRQRDDKELVAVSIRVEPELKKALKHAAADTGRSLNFMVERAIVNYLADNYPDYLPEELL